MGAQKGRDALARWHAGDDSLYLDDDLREFATSSIATAVDDFGRRDPEDVARFLAANHDDPVETLRGVRELNRRNDGRTDRASRLESRNWREGACIS